MKDLSGGTLEWLDGMLYPVLHKMDKDGLIHSRWDVSAEGRRRKYYAITEDGYAELASACTRSTKKIVGTESTRQL